MILFRILEGVIQVIRSRTENPAPSDFDMLGGIHFPNGRYEASHRLKSNCTSAELNEINAFIEKLNKSQESTTSLNDEVSARNLAISFHQSEKWFTDTQSKDRELIALKTLAAMYSLESILTKRKLLNS